jgi:hypothetical protein
VTDLEGRSPDLLAGHLVATNTRIHQALITALASPSR